MSQDPMRARPGELLNRKRARDAETGFILIAVLWISMLLSVFALNYATSSRLGAERAVTGERLVIEAHVLRSAVARAEHALRKYHANVEALELAAASDADHDGADEPEKAFFPRHEPRELEISGFQVQIRVASASARWNVNTLSPAMLETVLIACGREPGTETTSIVNSVLDWIDEDDLRRVEGAESPYYLSLEQPYVAKNSPLESIEELLLIRGIDAPLFWGTENRPGLIHFLTVAGQGGDKLDVNSAAPEAMALIPGISEETIEAIVQRRSEERIANMADLAIHVDSRDYDQLIRYFDVIASSRVTIEARVMDPATGRPGRPLAADIHL